MKRATKLTEKGRKREKEKGSFDEILDISKSVFLRKDNRE